MVKLDKVNWGIIGVGDVCEVKSGPAFQKISHSELVAVMRRDGGKAQDYAHRHGVAKWYDDASALLAQPEINAIYIATPPHMHCHYTLEAAKRGKAVYVEKPMARTWAECQEMVRICASYQVPLYVAYYRRALPHFQYIKSLIDQQAIGDIRLVNIRLLQPPKAVDLDPKAGEQNWRTQPELAGGGYFYDLAAHQLDYLDYIFGPIQEVSGIHKNQAGLYSAEDLVAGHFSWDSNIIGQGLWCFTVDPSASIDETIIVGSKGSIKFAFFEHCSVEVQRENQPKIVKDFTMPQHIQQPLIKTIVDELRGVGQCVSTGESGARTNRVLEQLLH